MSRCITTGRAGLLALLLLLPSLASAQITGQGFQVQNHGAFLGHAGTLNCGTNLTCLLVGGIVTLNASGGGSGTVTGSGTTTVFPIWTNGPGSVLGDSVFGQNTSAIVKSGSTAAVGGIGFNNAGNVEVVADGSTVVNAGLFAGAKIDFTIHDSSSENNTQFVIYNDADGISNAAAINVYGAYPNNALSICFGNGAGGATCANPQLSVSPSAIKGNASSFAWGPTGTVVTGSHSQLINLSAVSYGLALNNTFAVVRSAAGQQYDNLIFAQSNNQTEILNFETTNNAVGGILTVCAADAAGSCGGAQTRGVASFDAQDATNIVTLAVQSNPNAVKLINNQTGAGSPTEFQFWTPNGAHSYVSFKAPDTTASDLGVKMTLPSSYPASNGQALVSTTAGVLSWASFGTGTVTSIATTSPIAGGTITTTGTISCPTCITSAVTSATGTANQITVSASTGAVTWSLPSAVTMPGSLTVTTRTGTPATMAVFTSGGVLAETTLPTSGVTSIATTSPITGGTITTTGTIACATCVTSAASLTANAIVLGAGSQATSALGSLGTTTTVLHGNAAGAPTFGAVVLTTDVSGVLPVANGGVPTVISWSNAPIPADWGAQLLTMSSTLTVRYAQYVQIPYAITVNQITVAFGPVTTPGTFKECVYSADGSSKLIDITVTPVAASLVSGAVSAVTIGPGSFWFVIGGATTNSGVQIRSATTEAGVSSFGTAARPSGKTIWHGTVSHTSGTCNTTLGTVTATGDVIPNFFFDN